MDDAVLEKKTRQKTYQKDSSKNSSKNSSNSKIIMTTLVRKHDDAVLDIM